MSRHAYIQVGRGHVSTLARDAARRTLLLHLHELRVARLNAGPVTVDNYRPRHGDEMIATGGWCAPSEFLEWMERSS